VTEYLGTFFTFSAESRKNDCDNIKLCIWGLKSSSSYVFSTLALIISAFSMFSHSLSIPVLYQNSLFSDLEMAQRKGVNFD
jgi:hypothetical protein